MDAIQALRVVRSSLLSNEALYLNNGTGTAYASNKTERANQVAAAYNALLQLEKQFEQAERSL